MKLLSTLIYTKKHKPETSKSPVPTEHFKSFLSFTYAKVAYVPLQKFVLTMMLILLPVANTLGQHDGVSPELPLALPVDKIRPLRKLVDKNLQNKLERTLRSDRYIARLLDRQRMAVGIVALDDPDNIRFAALNGNQMMYAASLPKIAILLAAFQAIEDGRLPETPETMHKLRIMISQSSNQAATELIRMVGGFERIEEVLRDPRYQLYDPNWGGGLWVGKLYAKGGRRYPDPVLGTSHGATVTQVCRFYYMLTIGSLISPYRSHQMLEMMVDPEIHHKFVNSLDHIVPAAKVYRKSGTWRQWHADSALVWGPGWRRYIVVALIEDSKGEQIMRDIIPAVESVLHSQVKSK